MTPARSGVLREAEQWAVRLRQEGYTEVEVAPQYCIGNSIDGGMFTRTVCLFVGPRVEPAKRPSVLKRLKAWWNA